MAERQKQNAVQQRDPPQKQSLMDFHSNKKADSNQTTIWNHQPLTLVRSTQMVRATASSPSDMSHLRTALKQKTQQSMSLMKTPGSCFNNKQLTASKDRIPNC
jgi:cytidylate kinase